MKTEQAIARAGSAAALAKLLGITDSAISQWGEEMPNARIWQLQLLRPAWFIDADPANAQEPAVQGGAGTQQTLAEGGR